MTLRSSKDRTTPILGILTLITLLVGAYFVVVSPPDENQKDLVRILYLHVPASWMYYMACFGTFVYGLAYLFTRNRRWDRLSAASSEIGILMVGLSLLGGMIWGKPTFGAYWVWDDPRLTSTALALLIFIGYFIVRGLIEDPHRRARVAAVIGVVGMINVPINYMSVTWWRSIHQGFTVNLLGKTDLRADSSMLLALLFMTLAFTTLFFYFLRLRGILAERLEAREERLLERDLQLQGGD